MLVFTLYMFVFFKMLLESLKIFYMKLNILMLIISIIILNGSDHELAACVSVENQSYRLGVFGYITNLLKCMKI